MTGEAEVSAGAGEVIACGVVCPCWAVCCARIASFAVHVLAILCEES